MQTEFDMAQIHPILSEVLESGGEFCLYPKGTSMLPLIRAKKDAVLLIRAESLEKDGIYLYRRKNGQYVLHRLVDFTPEGEPIFCGDNQVRLEYGITERDIIARVRDILRDDGRYHINSSEYQRYLRRLHAPSYRFFRFLPRRVRARLANMLRRKK